VKPILTIKEGIVCPLNQVRSKKSAQERMLTLLEDQVPAGTTVWGVVAHGDNPNDAAWPAQQLRERYTCEQLYTAEMGPAVGTHGGPGIFGAAVFPVNTPR